MPVRESLDSLEDEEVLGEDRLALHPHDLADLRDMTGAVTKPLLMHDEADRMRRGAIGKERMGPPGAIDAVVAELTGD